MLTAILPDIDEHSLEDIAARLFAIPDGPSQMRLPLGLDRDSFLEFCERHPDLFTELESDGTVTIMSPLVQLSSKHEGEAYAQLIVWYKTAGRIGEVFNNSAGFTLPSGAVKAPDASWVSPERLAQVGSDELDHFARLVPDFVIEVRSKSDSLKRAQAKITDTWLDAGVRLAWLLDPRRRTAYVYRQGVQEPEVVTDFDGKLSAEEVVPGFVMDLWEFS